VARLGGWLLVLLGLGALGYSAWAMLVYPEMQLWGWALIAGAVTTATAMQGVRVLDRNARRKKVT
jgi:hypothetical protein